MARIRTVKPEFWTSEQIMNCSRDARLLFIGIWNFCDDAGRHPWRPRQIKAECFPCDDDVTSETILGMLQELSDNGLICRYEASGGEFLQVTGWHHQRIDKPQKPKHPSQFPEHSTNGQGTFPPDTIRYEGKGEEGKREKERKQEGADAPLKYPFQGKVVRLSKPDFDAWTKAYSLLDLPAELTARDAYLASEKATDADRKNWFQSTSQHLANRNRDAKAMRETAVASAAVVAIRGVQKVGI